MKVDPVPEDEATLPLVARGVNQVHLCLEDEKKKSAKHRTAVRAEIRALRKEQKRLSDAMLGPADGKRRFAPKLGAMTSWQAGWRIAVSTGSGLAAVFVIYRAAYALWPPLWSFLGTVNRIVLGAHF